MIDHRISLFVAGRCNFNSNKLMWGMPDAVSGAEAGLSPGYGLALVAETTTKRLLSAECCAVPGDKARLL